MKKTGRISQIDIARELGVHQNTISKALRDESDISPEMKAKVREAAKKLGYRSNRLANAIIRGKSTIIGVVFPQYHGQFFSKTLDSIETEAAARGYRILMSRSLSSPESTRTEVEFLLEYRVDGLIIADEIDKSDLAHYKSLIKSGEKIVWLNQKIEQPGSVSIYSDDISGTEQLIRHLIDWGHQGIAFCKFKNNQSFTTILRAERFASYMDSQGLTPVFLPLGSWKTYEADITSFFAQYPLVTAVICTNDGLALEIIHAFLNSGIKVPDDISVVGYGDDFTHVEHMKIPLTTVNQHPENMGKLAVDTLIDLMNGKSVPSEIRLSVDLVIRQSTKVL